MKKVQALDDLLNALLQHLATVGPTWDDGMLVFRSKNGMVLVSSEIISVRMHPHSVDIQIQKLPIPLRHKVESLWYDAQMSPRTSATIIDFLEDFRG